MSKTKTPTAAPAVEREPASVMLRIPPNCVSDPPEDKAELAAQIIDWERQGGEIHSSFEQRLRDLLHTSLLEARNEFPSIKADWELDTAAHTGGLAIFRWRIFDFWTSQEKANRKQAAELRAAYDQVRSDEAQNLTQLGMLKAMQAWPHNLEAAQRQLLCVVDTKEWVTFAKGAWADAEEALRILLTRQEAVPNRQTTTIRWPAFSADIAWLADMIGLSRVTTSPEVELSPQGVSIARDFGLQEAPLLPEHIDSIRQIEGLCPRQLYHPIMGAKADDLEAIRALVAQLPATEQVRQFLAASTGGRSPYEHVL